MTTNEIEGCRLRQQRLLKLMDEHRLDWVIVQQTEHVQYFTGPHFAPVFSPFAAISAAGRVVLVGPEKRIPKNTAADEVVSYVARQHSTMRNDQRQAASEILAQQIGASISSNSRIGVEFSSFSRHLPWDVEYVDVEPDLYRMRRRKDADELAKLLRAIAATGKMYERAREILQPGLCELDMFNELQSVAVRELGEPLTGTGNDYQCNSRGGSPRRRDAQAGELYILDLGPAYRGYFADNARTLAVTDPTPVQLEAWEHVTQIFAHVEATVRPGVSAQQLFHSAQEMLDRAPVGVFNHHLGHGIGMFPHEAPHLNPFWDDTFAVGDVFTAEPGLYAPELNAGLRLENDYLVTENGVRRLTEFPLELKL
ncbi:MAG: aminopeptidase P family protein [Planctomycetales bacterium]|nr:aminopeptidase P family protein [Planctomycetales bacterium]